ncbi:MAG: hypothetical protein AAF543_12460 [Pseudomonadota bacterium]
MAAVLILSMLSACAGRVHHQQVADAPIKPASETYADAVETITEDENERRRVEAEHDVVSVAHHAGHHRHHDPRGHEHREPSPEAQAAAETVLILMGSAFLCTFVVVVLDGACEFGAHAGYYY